MAAKCRNGRERPARQANPRGQTRRARTTTTGAGATTTRGATTTAPPLGRQPPWGPRWKPGPQPPAAFAALKPASVLATKTAAKSVFMFSPFVVSRDVVSRDAAPDHDSNRAIRQRRGFAAHQYRFREHGARCLTTE